MRFEIYVWAFAVIVIPIGVWICIEWTNNKDEIKVVDVIKLSKGGEIGIWDKEHHGYVGHIELVYDGKTYKALVNDIEDYVPKKRTIGRAIWDEQATVLVKSWDVEEREFYNNGHIGDLLILPDNRERVYVGYLVDIKMGDKFNAKDQNELDEYNDIVKEIEKYSQEE